MKKPDRKPRPSELESPSVHELEIANAFPELSYTGSAPVFDEPLIVLGFTNRSGSNLLGEYLVSTGKFAGFREELNYGGVIKRGKMAKLSSFPKVLEAMARKSTPDGAIYGVKASSHQLMMLLRWNIHRMFNGIKIVHIKREDVIDQAISHAIALETQQWTSLQSESDKPEIEFSYSKISHLFKGIQRANSEFDLISQTLGIPKMVVTYNQVSEQPKQTIHSVGAFLQVDLSAWEPPEPELKKQATSRNTEFKALFAKRFRSQMRIDP